MNVVVRTNDVIDVSLDFGDIALEREILMLKGEKGDTGDPATEGGITSRELANNAVITSKIADNAVTNAKMADNSVNTAELVNGAVTEGKLANGAVTLAKLGADVKLTLVQGGKLSGDIATFNDSVGGFNVNRIVADLEPIQLGSGDPSPSNIRPILGHTEVETTGTGKNILPSKKYLQGNGIQFGFNGTRSVTNYTMYLPVGTYTFSFTASDATTTNFYVENVATGERAVSGGIASNFTFNITTAGNYAIWVWKSTYTSVDTILSAQLEKGSSATTYEPSSDPVLTEIGINQWDEEWEVGRLNSTTGGNEDVTGNIRSKNYVPLPANKTFYAYLNNYTGANRIAFYDTNKNFISGGVGWRTLASGIYSPTEADARKVPEAACYMRFYVVATSYNSDISINAPSRFTGYYPYTGIGPVYGGTLDVTSGKLTATNRVLSTAGLVAANISTVQTVGSLTRFWLYVANKTVGDVRCDRIATSNGSTYGQEVVDMYGADANYPQSIWMKLPTSLVGTTAASILTYLQTSGIQIAYTLAEPRVYQLEPQDVQTVLGQNNIYTDSGEVNVWYVAGLS